MTRQLNPIVVGALFKDKAELKNACQMLATHENFEYTILKSDKSRMTIKCSGEGCSWRLHASKVGDTVKDGSFEIKTMHDEHKCLGVQHFGHHQVSAEFIAEKIQEKIRNRSSYRSK